MQLFRSADYMYIAGTFQHESSVGEDSDEIRLGGVAGKNFAAQGLELVKTNLFLLT